MLNPNVLMSTRQTVENTSSGPCAVPILYRDGSMLVVGYRIDPTRAKASFGGLPLEPLTVWRRALALLCVFEYRDTTIGPYNELGVGVYARRTGRAPSILRVLRDMRPIEEVGLYVTNLPVNTAAAHTAGVELWGFSKSSRQSTLRLTRAASSWSSPGSSGSHIHVGVEFNCLARPS